MLPPAPSMTLAENERAAMRFTKVWKIIAARYFLKPKRGAH